MTLIFLLTQRVRLSGPSRYPEHVRTVYWEFSRDIWKRSFISKHEVLSEYSNIIFSLVSSSCFELKLYFQTSLENFLCTLQTCSRYLKGAPNLDLCISNKIVTVRHIDQNICQEKWKNLFHPQRNFAAPLYIQSYARNLFFKDSFQLFRTFPAIFSFLRVVWCWFFYWRKELG